MTQETPPTAAEPTQRDFDNARTQMNERVAANLRSALAWRGLKHWQAAGRLGMSTAAISRRLSGEVPCDPHDLIQIAGLVDLPVERLILGGPPWDDPGPNLALI